jgi:type IV pilus assembly protein PilW
MKRPQAGFSLVELMIAIAIAMVAALVVLQVLSIYQARKQTTVGRNDAQISAALGLYEIESETRMSGAGFTTPNGQLCSLGINIAYNNVTTSDRDSLRGIRIVDGGAGTPDTLELMRSNAALGAAPTTILQLMASTTAAITVDSRAGLTSGDLLIAAAPDSSKVCTLMQLSQAPVANGTSWNLVHTNTSSSLYNPTNPSSSFSTAVNYDAQDIIINLGAYGIRRYGVICNDQQTPRFNNNCDLVWYPRGNGTTIPALASANSIASQIIDFQTQYGIADANSATVNDWVDATGIWAAPSLTNQRRIRAIRLAIVARGNQESGTVAPASLTLWNDGVTPAATRTLSTEERRYRYQVLSVVVPLINVIWSGQ